MTKNSTSGLAARDYSRGGGLRRAAGLRGFVMSTGVRPRARRRNFGGVRARAADREKTRGGLVLPPRRTETRRGAAGDGDGVAAPPRRRDRRATRAGGMEGDPRRRDRSRARAALPARRPSRAGGGAARGLCGMRARGRDGHEAPGDSVRAHGERVSAQRRAARSHRTQGGGDGGHG